MQIKETVFEALKNASNNDEFAQGGNLHGLTAAQVADDLAAFDADLENVSPIEIEPHVAEWMDGQNWLNGNPNAS